MNEGQQFWDHIIGIVKISPQGHYAIDPFWNQLAFGCPVIADVYNSGISFTFIVWAFFFTAVDTSEERIQIRVLNVNALQYIF